MRCDANHLFVCRLLIIKTHFRSVLLATWVWLAPLLGNKTQLHHSRRTRVSPGPGWSGTQSSPLRPDAGAGWKTVWKCWPRLPVHMGTDIAACCDASPSERCLGMSPGQNPRLASAEVGRRPPGQSQCSHRQTWKRKNEMEEGKMAGPWTVLVPATLVAGLSGDFADECNRGQPTFWRNTNEAVSGGMQMISLWNKLKASSKIGLPSSLLELLYFNQPLAQIPNMQITNVQLRNILVAFIWII